MTISTADNTPRISYTVNQGVTQTAFSVPFEFFADADLNVYVDGTKKTLATHYTTSANAQNNSAHVEGETGYIHTTTGNSVVGATGGSTVVITRDIVLSRTSDFPIAGAFDIKELNDELDRNIAIASDLNDLATRTIRLKDFDTGTLELPIATERANTFMKFNSDGNLIVSSEISDFKFGQSIIFEGATANDYETTVTVTDPTADRTWTIPDVTDTFVGTTATQTLTNKSLGSVALTSFSNSETLGVAIGQQAYGHAMGVTVGSRSAVGVDDNTTIGSISIGYEAMEHAEDAEYNIAIGWLALNTANTGNDTDHNIGIGYYALKNQNNYEGSYNIGIGYSTGNSITTGDGNLLLGYCAEPSSATSNGEFKINTKNGSDTVTYLSGTASGATGTVLVNNHLTVGGDLTVNGDTVTVNTATLSVEDPLIILAKANNSSDNLDIGFYGLYDTSGSQDLYAGLFRDANDSGKWKLFKDLQEAPTTTVNTSGGGYAVGTLVANVEGNVTGDVSGTAGIATSITASANNSEDETVYPTFVDGATGTQGLETDTGLTYNPSSGVLTATQFTGALSGNSTSATTATNANHVSVANNENEDENNLIPFIEDESATGNVGLESDGDLTYNPSTGRLSATQLAGTLQTASQTNITGVGTISTGVWNGSAIADGYISSSSTWNAKVDTGGTGLTKVGTTLNVDAAQSGITSVGTLTSLTTSGDITFEGATADAHETTFTVTDPTQDNTITLPDTTGTVALTSPNILAGTLLTTTTVSDDATVDFNSTYVTSTYDHYDLLITGLIPATDNTWLGLRFGTANSADSGSTKYSYIVYYVGSSNSDGYQINYNYDGQSSTILLTTVTNFSMGTGTGEGLSMHIRCWDLSSTSLYKKASPIAVGTMSSGTYFGQSYASVGGYKEASAVNFISLHASSGNLASGTVSLYGIKKG